MRVGAESYRGLGGLALCLSQRHQAQNLMHAGPLGRNRNILHRPADAKHTKTERHSETSLCQFLSWCLRASLSGFLPTWELHLKIPDRCGISFGCMRSPGAGRGAFAKFGSHLRGVGLQPGRVLTTGGGSLPIRFLVVVCCSRDLAGGVLCRSTWQWICFTHFSSAWDRFGIHTLSQREASGGHFIGSRRSNLGLEMLHTFQLGVGSVCGMHALIRWEVVAASLGPGVPTWVWRCCTHSSSVWDQFAGCTP